MRNFVLTIVDGLRADVPDFNNLRKVVSPKISLDRELSSLQSLWSKGTSITNWNTTHLKPEPALGSLLTGSYPREHGIYGSEAKFNYKYRTLVDYFSHNGFHTILMNGHKSYYSNGIAAKFNETLMGPPQRLFTRLKELNKNGKPVMVVYETLDLREPYLLSKFPPTTAYHDNAVHEANEIAEALGYDHRFEREDVHLMTSDWEIPQATTSKSPVWTILTDFVHEHYRSETRLLDNPVEHLVRYYLNTLELMSKNIFKTIRTFLCNDEAGNRTTMFITSNSAHGFTQREGVQTFGQRSKPSQDATRVPALFVNSKQTPSTNPELMSHVDLLPTVLDDFGIDYDQNISGQSLFLESFFHERIFVEASRNFSSTHEENESENDEENFGDCSILTWSSVLDSKGWKLYMRGLPVNQKDLNLPLREFLWRIMAKVTLTSPNETELKQRAEDFRGEDNQKARKELLRKLKKNSDPQFQLFDWKQDYFEKEDKLQSNLDQKSRNVIDDLISELTHRFDDPYNNIQNQEVEERKPEKVDLLPPIKAVGYVE